MIYPPYKNEDIMTKRSIKTLLYLLVPCLMASPLNSFAAEEAPSDEEAIVAYIIVPPYSVSMFHKGRPRGTLTVSVQLRILDTENRKAAEKFMPRLSNAYVMETTRLAIDFFDVNRPVNLMILGDSLQRVTNKILGHDQSQILIANAIVQKK